MRPDRDDLRAPGLPASRAARRRVRLRRQGHPGTAARRRRTPRARRPARGRPGAGHRQPGRGGEPADPARDRGAPGGPGRLVGRGDRRSAVPLRGDRAQPPLRRDREDRRPQPRRGGAHRGRERLAVSLPSSWGLLPGEEELVLPGDELAGPGWVRLLRAAPCAAPPERLWPWLGQLRVAPYSYDLVDNLGRRSPRTLTPGLGPVEVGQRVNIVFEVVDVEEGRGLTTRGRVGGPFADVVVGYAVRPAPGGSRLLAVLRHPPHRGLLAAADTALAWGDLLGLRRGDGARAHATEPGDLVPVGPRPADRLRRADRRRRRVAGRAHAVHRRRPGDHLHLDVREPALVLADHPLRPDLRCRLAAGPRGLAGGAGPRARGRRGRPRRPAGRDPHHPQGVDAPRDRDRDDVRARSRQRHHHPADAGPVGRRVVGVPGVPRRPDGDAAGVHRRAARAAARGSPGGGAGVSPEERYDEHSRARLVPEPAKRVDAPVRTAFERDRARVVHSASLRRLAAKTQVVGPASHDFVRNRLTHSLEVAQIARDLAHPLGCHPDLAETAALAHDLGHPPFGHNGERVLDRLGESAGGFEGNAQTLRILTRLEAKSVDADGSSVGLNLTRATLDACTKYPWERAAGAGPGAKFGVYPDDRPVFAWLREGVDGPRRCVEAQVMDVADDVAYSVHDLEDGIVAGRVDLGRLADPGERSAVWETVRAWYLPATGDAELEASYARLRGVAAWPERSYDGSRGALARLKNLTSDVIGIFCGAVHAATTAVHGPRPLVRHDADLVVPEETLVDVAVLKGVAAHYVMQAEDRVRDMARQGELLEELYAGLRDGPPTLLAPEYREDLAAAGDDAARTRVLLDAIASLTDASAVALHARVISDQRT
ncbi:hypothetical protein LUZ63_020743 [Rhynchospora breviuscula]|uniref:HD domain-containing protein n=1 Tax=Rhynchospora breviuscula TaxID=2022672 RepID=A0A9Q0C0G9_9POAL|nr:hypothetical protein LUZ63_020743 [Rhynchospora breviuscula]